MNQLPDELFKQKLGNDQRPVPFGAWEKIDARLSKKNPFKKWFLAAAAVLLVAEASFLLLNSGKPDIHSGTISNNTISPQKNIPLEKPVTRDSTLLPVSSKTSSQKKVKQNPNRENQQIQKTPENNEDETPMTLPSTLAEVPFEPEKKNSVVEPTDSQILVVRNTPKEDIQSSTGFKLILEVDEVNEKYFKDPSPTEATVAAKKPSKLKKILNKAQELKTNQDPFGELRQKKNEILALNFKNEKNEKH